jgi:HlyD family secretion protein
MQRRIGIILAAVLVIGGLAWWRWQAVRQNNNHAIRGSGIIEITEVDVAFEVPGTVAERYVDEGSLLDKGEPIARLDDREYRLHVERAAAAKAATESRYQMVLKGPRGQEIDQAFAALEAAEAELDTQQREYQRLKSLYDSAVVSRAEFDRVSTMLAAAQAARDQARAQLDMLKEGFRAEEIEQARSLLREAEKALALAELNLSRCQLFAPIAGRVLSKNREAGETVPAVATARTTRDVWPTRPSLQVQRAGSVVGEIVEKAFGSGLSNTAGRPGRLTKWAKRASHCT